MELHTRKKSLLLLFKIHGYGFISQHDGGPNVTHGALIQQSLAKFNRGMGLEIFVQLRASAKTASLWTEVIATTISILEIERESTCRDA